MKLLIFDNHDSFTYNLVQIIREWGKCSFDVVADEQFINLDLNDYDKILLSPGPGLPAESLRLLTVIPQCAGRMPIMGVCLGHQAIAVAFGGQLQRARRVVHGEVSLAKKTGISSPLFRGIPDEFEVGRYHSWTVDPSKPGSDIQVTAETADGTIMALQHRTLPVFGVQFHPESVMTPLGAKIVRNWLEL